MVLKRTVGFNSTLRSVCSDRLLEKAVFYFVCLFVSLFFASLPAESLTLRDLKEVKVVSVQAPSGQWCRARVEGITDNKVRFGFVFFSLLHN